MSWDTSVFRIELQLRLFVSRRGDVGRAVCGMGRGLASGAETKAPPESLAEGDRHFVLDWGVVSEPQGARRASSCLPLGCNISGCCSPFACSHGSPSCAEWHTRRHSSRLWSQVPLRGRTRPLEGSAARESSQPSPGSGFLDSQLPRLLRCTRWRQGSAVPSVCSTFGSRSLCR